MKYLLSRNKFFGIFFLFSLFSINIYAQLATKHYIPPIFGRENLGCYYLVLSTPSDVPFDVTIKDGSGNFIATQNISSFSSSTYSLGCGDTTQFMLTQSELNTALTGKGFILEASEPFYVNLRILAGPQAGSLTSKGDVASLGTDFRAGFMYNNKGDAFRKSNSIGVLATEDSTIVNFTDIRKGVVLVGTTPTGTPLTSSDTSIVLNAGESYVIANFLDDTSATENINGMNGIHITSDKPIAVNTATWLGGNCMVNGHPYHGRDLGIDEIVPIEKIGNEYVVIKGEGLENERVIVVPTEDSTKIYLNGSSTPVATVNAGDYYVIVDTLFSANDNLYIETSANVYVYQTANGGDGNSDDNERQCGLNFLPPVGCTGGKAVFLPDVDFIGEAQINIIADAGAKVIVDGTDVGDGDTIPGTSNYVTYKLNNSYSGDIEVTSDKLIRVSLINLSGNVGAAGYFSGFTKDVAINTQTINSDNIAKEGCVNGSFDFFIGSPSSTDTKIDFTISGTATNGVDYKFIDNSVIIPAGQTSATITIEAIQDGIAEGQESIYLIYQPELCGGVDTAFLYIDDAEPIQFTINPKDLSCYGDSSGEILFNATGGTQPYTYYIKDEDDKLIKSKENPTTGLAAGRYTVQVYDVYGCKAEALVVGGQFNAGRTFLPDGNGVTYTSTLPISGFRDGETITDMEQIQQICVNMEHSYLGDLNIKIIAPSGESVVLKGGAGGSSCDLGEPVATGPVDGTAGSQMTDPGKGFDYCFSDSPDYGTMIDESNNYTHTYTDSLGHNLTDNYLPAGVYTSEEPLSNLLGATKNGDWVIEVTDQFSLDNGYIFYWNISILGEDPDTVAHLKQPEGMTLTGDVEQSSCGESNGAIDLSITETVSPYEYLWSNGDTTQDIGLIPSGAYTVTVTDANGCSRDTTFLLNSNTSLSASAEITNNLCHGGNTGAIDMTVEGGTTPYSYNWQTGASTEDIANLTADDYFVTITDAEGCDAVESFTVGENPLITVSSQTIKDEVCGTSNGSIDIEVDGGSGSYGYVWSNGAKTQDITDIEGGTYIVTITDGFNCEVTSQFDVHNDVSNCSAYCYLDLTSSVTDDNCGNGEGAIDITVTDAENPYIVKWSNGETTEDIENLVEGDYTVTVTDANNCQIIRTLTVGNNTGTLTVDNISINNETCGRHNGAIDITTEGGALPYVFAWNTGDTTEDITDLSAGTYQIQIVDGDGCKLTQYFEVENNTGDLSATAVITDEICGNSKGKINLSVTGNDGALSYQWSNGSHNEDITNLSAGDYVCTITDDAGCKLQVSYDVDNSSGDLAIVNSRVINETCRQANGAIDIVVTGGDGKYLYTWNTGDTIEDISGLSEGVYVLAVTDSTGCQVQSDSMYVFNTGGNIDIETVLAVNEICGNELGSINISVTGGDGNYLYHWNTGSSSEDLTNLSAGDYALTVTDGNNCQQTYQETIINEQGTLSHDNTIVTHEDCGQANGAIDLVISGGTTPYSFNWNTGQSSEDITNLTEGQYECTVTDANGCEVFTSTTIKNNADLSETHTVTAEHCADGLGAVDISVTGSSSPFSYAWSNGETTEDLDSLSAGDYSCTITDANGCSIRTGDIKINNNVGDLSVSVQTTNDTCNKATGFIQLTPSGGTSPYSYIWSTGDTLALSDSLSAGTYAYTLADANGCEITDTAIVINESGHLRIDSVVIDNELCNDNAGSINLTITTGSAPVTFSWSNGTATEDLSGLDEGTYICTITDTNGCQVISDEYRVTNASDGLAVTDITVINENCGDGKGAVNITTEGGTTPLSYAWSNGDISQNISDLSADIYTCEITDSNGCSVTTNATVNNDAGNLTIFESEVKDEACNKANGSIDIRVLGGTPDYHYAWSNGATTEDLTNLSADTYSVQVTDQNGCSQTYQTTIQNVGADFAITKVVLGDEICGNEQGYVDITTNDGTTPYNFSWSNGATSEDIDNLSAGNYSVTVSDVNGCTTSAAYTVDANTGTLQLDTFEVTNETCGQADGKINLTYSGGKLPINILWSNDATTEDLSNLSADTYTVTVTDKYGCSFSQSGIVENETGGFAVSNQTVTNEHCLDSSGAVDLTITGGTTPYSYVWNTGDTTEDIDHLTAGDYSATITDANGCKLLVTQTIINQTTGITIDTAYTGNDRCSTNKGYIDLVVSGGTTPYTYEWNNGATTEDLDSITEGDYRCVVTDNAGCSVISDIYTITNTPSDLSASSTSIPVMCMEKGEITVNASDGFYPYSYIWNTGDTTQTIDNLDTGTYNVTITDVAGCTITHSQLVTELPSTLTILRMKLKNEICENKTGSIDITVSGGTPDFAYEWSTGDTIEDINGLSANTYFVTVTDAKGCVYNDSCTIANDSGTLVLDTLVPHDINCNNSSGWIDLTYTGGVEPVNVLWNNGETEEDAEDLVAGVYTVTITDAEGCKDSLQAEVFDYSDFAITDTTVINDTCNRSVGAIDITVLSGKQPLSYIWNTGDTTEDLANIKSDYYQCTVTSADGCELVAKNLFVDDIAGFTLTANIIHSTCRTCDNGSIDLSENGYGNIFTFSWTGPGSFTSTNEDIQNLLPGTYAVHVENDLNCSIDTSYQILFSDGITETASDIHITAYPNPTDGPFTVEYQLKEKLIELDVYNAVGQKVISKNLGNSEGTVRLDFKNLAHGIYNVKLYTKDKTYNFKVLYQK